MVPYPPLELLLLSYISPIHNLLLDHSLNYILFYSGKRRKRGEEGKKREKKEKEKERRKRREGKGYVTYHLLYLFQIESDQLPYLRICYS
jgi:hypothetical protein